MTLCTKITFQRTVIFAVQTLPYFNPLLLRAGAATSSDLESSSEGHQIQDWGSSHPAGNLGTSSIENVRHSLRNGLLWLSRPFSAGVPSAGAGGGMGKGWALGPVGVFSGSV